MSKILGRDAILSIDDLKKEEVEIPEWGGSVIVRSLTGIERDALESELYMINGKNIKQNLENVRAKFVAKSVVDEEGQRIFSDQDVEQLGRKSASALDRIFMVAQKLSGLSNNDVQALAKN